MIQFDSYFSDGLNPFFFGGGGFDSRTFTMGLSDTMCFFWGNHNHKITMTHFMVILIDLPHDNASSLGNVS